MPHNLHLAYPSYWNHKGELQASYEALRRQIPASGSCPKDRPALERLRKAGNYYYDLYNNGLCNRAAGFQKMFGVTKSVALAAHPSTVKKIDNRITELVADAWKEMIINDL